MLHCSPRSLERVALVPPIVIVTREIQHTMICTVTTLTVDQIWSFVLAFKATPRNETATTLAKAIKINNTIAVAVRGIGVRMITRPEERGARRQMGRGAPMIMIEEEETKVVVLVETPNPITMRFSESQRQ